MRREEFLLGLARIIAATNGKPDDAQVEVYLEALSTQFEAAEWDTFTRDAASKGTFRYWPTIAEILDQIRGRLDLEAQQAYDRVVRSSEYSPEVGSYWTARRIKERCGDAAVEAWLAAGGNEAFSTTFRADERRRAFLEAYRLSVRQSPERRLLPEASEQRLLGAGTELERAPSESEAAEILRKLAGELPPEPPMMKRGAIVERDDARIAVLRRQAEEYVENF